jgi:uncharacterized MAPEG superfamily protein
MSELLCLELSVVLWFVHVACQIAFANAALPHDFLAGPRDTPVPPKGVMYGRATRALGNYVENFTAFAALDLGLIVTGHVGGWGSTIWILARIAYLPVYLLGIAYLRTAIAIVAIIGLVLMLVRLSTG